MIMRSLHDLCVEDGDSARVATQFATQWHGSDWSEAEDHWEQLVTLLLQTEGNGEKTAKAALRDSEQMALDFLRVSLPARRSTCPICRSPHRAHP